MSTGNFLGVNVTEVTLHGYENNRVYEVTLNNHIVFSSNFFDPAYNVAEGWANLFELRLTRETTPRKTIWRREAEE